MQALSTTKTRLLWLLVLVACVTPFLPLRLLNPEYRKLRKLADYLNRVHPQLEAFKSRDIGYSKVQIGVVESEGDQIVVLKGPLTHSEETELKRFMEATSPPSPISYRY